MIPVVKVKEIIEAILDTVSYDYTAQTDKTDSWLYRTLNGITGDDYNYYKEGIDVFTRDDKSSRKLEVRTQYDKTVATMPTLFIRVPSEKMSTGNGLGMGQDSDTNYENSDGSLTVSYSQVRDSIFELVIITKSHNELLMIYEVLFNACNAMFILFEQNFENCKIDGKDVFLPTEIYDTNYGKVINISVRVRRQIASFTPETIATAIRFYTPEIIP